MENGENRAKTYGEKLVDALIDGSFHKNYLPNHGPDFMGGLEGLHFYYFSQYLGSCGCYLMESRLEKEDYHG